MQSKKIGRVPHVRTSVHGLKKIGETSRSGQEIEPGVGVQQGPPHRIRHLGDMLPDGASAGDLQPIVDARLGGDQYCCRGQWSSRAACNPAQWPVDYAAVFKSAEPYAYSYVDDDATSVFTVCPGIALTANIAPTAPTSTKLPSAP